MSRKKAILFDLDDTLIVEWKSAEASFIETVAGSAIPVDPHEFLSVIRQVARTYGKIPGLKNKTEFSG